MFKKPARPKPAHQSSASPEAAIQVTSQPQGRNYITISTPNVFQYFHFSPQNLQKSSFPYMPYLFPPVWLRYRAMCRVAFEGMWLRGTDCGAHTSEEGEGAFGGGWGERWHCSLCVFVRWKSGMCWMNAACWFEICTWEVRTKSGVYSWEWSDSYISLDVGYTCNIYTPLFQGRPQGEEHRRYTHPLKNIEIPPHYTPIHSV